MPATDKKARKDKVFNTIQECLQKYSKIIFVNVDNVTSKQICIMRKALRAIDAQMVMGKNVSTRPHWSPTPLGGRHAIAVSNQKFRP